MGGLITRTGGTVCGGGANNKDRGYDKWRGGLITKTGGMGGGGGG